MSSIYSASAGQRLLHAVSTCLRTHPGEFLKAWVRYPLVVEADRALATVPTASFAELFPQPFDIDYRTLLGELDRHEWNISLDEEILLGLIIQVSRAQTIFEIGTFNGATTCYMARAAGAAARLYTLDLPPAEFDERQTQVPRAFTGRQVGKVFSNGVYSQQIQQLLGDSKTFDFSPYVGKMDLVLVDAAHDYIHGLSDSRNALRLVKPGGVVLWDDFCSGWPGLVHAIIEATQGRPLHRLTGTALGVLRC